jgi:hypothetical protein
VPAAGFVALADDPLVAWADAEVLTPAASMIASTTAKITFEILRIIPP